MDAVATGNRENVALLERGSACSDNNRGRTVRGDCAVDRVSRGLYGGAGGAEPEGCFRRSRSQPSGPSCLPCTVC